MSFKERTVGGGPAKQLGQNWTNLLDQLITHGSVGGQGATQQFSAANPVGDTGNLFTLLNSIISNPQADKSVQDLIHRDTERGRNELQESFGGGTSMGTPAAFAQALFESEQAPRATMAMDEMARNRLAAILPLLGFAHQTAGLGIPQAQSTLEPPKWLQAINLGLDVANTAANFIPGSSGGTTNRSTGPQLQPTKAGSLDLPNYAMFAPPPKSFAQQLYT